MGSVLSKRKRAEGDQREETESRPAKRTRLDDEDANDAFSQDTSSLLLSLPSALLVSILSYTPPEYDRYHWEWAVVIGQTCKTLRRLAPKSIKMGTLCLDDYFQYMSMFRLYPIYYHDARLGLLNCLRKSKYLSKFVTKLSINRSCLLEAHLAPPMHAPIDDSLLDALRLLLSKASSLPNLISLDINLCGAWSGLVAIPLFDRESFMAMPYAIPNCTDISFGCCFEEEISPSDFFLFFDTLRRENINPLTGLTLEEIDWLSNQQIWSMMPIIGGDLTRLMFIRCGLPIGFGACVSDSCLPAIAQFCRKLESFHLCPGNPIRANSLALVLERNPHIREISVASTDPALPLVLKQFGKELNVFRARFDTAELADQTLEAIIDGQKDCDCESGVVLRTIDIHMHSFDSLLSKGILRYALQNGVRFIDGDTGEYSYELMTALESEFPGTRFRERATGRNLN